jgi:hypothetical protein
MIWGLRDMIKKINNHLIGSIFDLHKRLRNTLNIGDKVKIEIECELKSIEGRGYCQFDLDSLDIRYAESILGESDENIQKQTKQP